MRFITFRSLKWMLDWMGPFDIELYPTNENVLVCHIIPNEILKSDDRIQTAVDTSNNDLATSTKLNKYLVLISFFLI